MAKTGRVSKPMLPQGQDHKSDNMLKKSLVGVKGNSSIPSKENYLFVYQMRLKVSLIVLLIYL